MRIFRDLDESLIFFKAMSSDVRIQLIKTLISNPGMNLNELSKQLNITGGALTSHIRILEQVGIIKTTTMPARHGVQKICHVVPEKYLVQIANNSFISNAYQVELSPGHYIDYEVQPTCGIATPHRIVGVYDDPVYFADTERFGAQILWFASGFVEYDIPNYLPADSICTELFIQAELGSEAVSFNNDYKSDIRFKINGQIIGYWQSPGDFGGVKGFYNPEWWVSTLNQFGTLMEIRVNSEGTFADGKQVSDVSVGRLGIEPRKRLRLRLEAPIDAPNSGGLTVFGRGFGNYNNAILVNVCYKFRNEEGPDNE